jgi:hypothetical protein
MEPRNRSQREPQSLEAWETWVDKLIVEAQERGDFDDLPGHGKPLRIEESPFAGGMDLGFGILKNAGVAPYWVELEKELRAAVTQLEAIALQAVALAPQSVASQNELPAATQNALRTHKKAWWPFRRDKTAVRPNTVPVHDARARELASLRRRYLEQAEVVDRLIAQYNAAIPRTLWHLERPRLTQDAAGQAFDRLTTSGSLEMPRSGKDE